MLHQLLQVDSRHAASRWLEPPLRAGPRAKLSREVGCAAPRRGV